MGAPVSRIAFTCGLKLFLSLRNTADIHVRVSQTEMADRIVGSEGHQFLELRNCRSGSSVHQFAAEIMAHVEEGGIETLGFAVFTDGRHMIAHFAVDEGKIVASIDIPRIQSERLFILSNRTGVV